MWVITVIGILAVIVVLLGLFFMRRGLSKESLEQKPVRMSIGMAVGGIIGVVIGIAAVEFAGFEYPFPAITWMLGMAAGQIIGLVYKKKVRR